MNKKVYELINDQINKVLELVSRATKGENDG